MLAIPLNIIKYLKFLKEIPPCFMIRCTNPILSNIKVCAAFVSLQSKEKVLHREILIPSVGSSWIDYTWFINDMCDMGPDVTRDHEWHLMLFPLQKTNRNSTDATSGTVNDTFQLLIEWASDGYWPDTLTYFSGLIEGLLTYWKDIARPHG